MNSNTYAHTNTSEQITYQILVKDLKTSAIRSSCKSVCLSFPIPTCLFNAANLLCTVREMLA